ncbi:MAG: class I SAM-dependent methyltransferase [Ignavibacteriales bacterium]|nr:class I SAM-dependent methyltransferase [Ignavibacteriales bacterium]
MNESNLLCPVCGNRNLGAKPFGYLFKNRWLNAVECKKCTIIFINPQPTNQEIASLYSKEYFEHDFRCGHTGSYFDESALASLGEDKLLVQFKKFKDKGTFLEIGCAGGAFLNTLREAGYSVQGVEYSSEATQFAKERFNLNIHTGDLLSAKFDDNMFDLVYMGDVLEHLPDPNATLGEIHRIMKQGGVLGIRCPMQTNTLYSRIGFMVYTLLRKRATVHLPPYHLFEYRAKSIKYLLNSHQFKIELLNQTIMPVADISLRGSALQKLMKKLFQYPNVFLTRTLKVFGDRIEIFASKEK